MPKKFKILPNNWSKRESGRKGAMVRYKRYGNPGTLEGRKKGGKRSAKSLFKYMNYPKHSNDLAELIGIILGDGNITTYQLRIYFNSEDDKDYIKFVDNLIKRLFDIKPSHYKYKFKKLAALVVSRKELVSFLCKQGLLIGNKVKNGVTIPEWIMKDINFSQSAARGLMDTDGSFFDEHHKYKSKIYSYKVLTFTNYSYPLIEQYKKILKKLGIEVIINSRKRLSVRTDRQIKRYLDLIGTNNPKHAKKIINFGGVA